MLRAGEARADGYHPLLTVFLGLSLRETVTVSAGENSDGITCEVRGEPSLIKDIPTGADNLAVRAVIAVREHVESRPHLAIGPARAAHIVIDKQVPAAGGMAGGSADAAAALVAANEVFAAGQIARTDLMTIAADLGADIPFCLHGGAAIGRERGDDLQALAAGELFWTLVTSPEPLKTPDVFAAYDDFATFSEGDELQDVPAEFYAALADGDAHRLAAYLENDLTEAALDLQPALADAFAALHRAGALGVILSGSGPTVAGLALDEAHAHSIAEVVRNAQVGKEVLVVSSPSPGAMLSGQPAIN